ncbi:hypothetical protein E2542_SST02105 [Spatholobus suberectus]|nr:hypothetical protein E2542_SST02105 [Spatholobus suberectus]
MSSWPFMALEGIFIAYLYSLFITIDTIVSCMFYKSCKVGLRGGQEEKHFLRIEFPEEDNCGYLIHEHSLDADDSRVIMRSIHAGFKFGLSRVFFCE